MKRMICSFAALIVFAALMIGCGVKKEVGEEDNRTLKNAGSTPVVATEPNLSGFGTVNAVSEPGGVRGFLNDQHILHGDIYLKDDKVFINIVGLNDNVRKLLAEQYAPDSYQLVNVSHSIEELEEAQKKLSESDLYRTQNLYGSGIDVIKNKIVITMPSASEAEAKPVIGKLIDPDLISYDIQAISEKPEYEGTIVSIDTTNHHILILEDGQEEPSIYFGFNEHSEIVDAQGSPIAFDDLMEQQKVRVWSAGMINESFPAQGTARRLELAEG
ncbi:DUF3221 domain-containing protein [Paenibacillus silvisoli]|uniref:DUF3221 domain-containing protein n=1 Tax=Paenibacillus silvisoli TaxID=3110539 RepID=UPI0028043BFF|nr:DUF3221 domain-containing protein [Paenibacillus silvisoli]